MTVDNFSNAAETTLNGAINNSTTAITVTSATGFPANTPFRIRIKAESGNLDEICTVTAGAGTTSWTVTRASESYAGAQAGQSHSDGATVQHVLTVEGFLSVTTPMPDITQSTSGFQTSSTTNGITFGATPTKGLICLVFGTTRGASSITQTNVTWTQRYTGNGNSQFFEVWTGAISGTAGTSVTVNFASATRSNVEVYEINHADFTSVGTAVTNTGSATTIYTMGPLTSPSRGSICVGGITTNGAGSQYGGMNIPFFSANFFGGQGRGVIFIFNEIAMMWAQTPTALTYFGAMMSIS